LSHRPALFYPRFPGNPHIAGIRARFPRLAVPPEALPPLRRVVLLCFTNRTGSNAVAAMLAGSGVLNRAEECLSAGHILREAEAHALPSFAATIGRIASAAVAGNFALKVAPSHLEVLGESGLLECWRDCLHIIHLERLDRLAQAISWQLAEQTGQWTSLSEATAEPVYSRGGLLVAIDDFAEGNRQFARFFGLNGLCPTHVTYEDFATAPSEYVARLLGAIGLPPIRTRLELLRLQRQSGPRNAAWRARFLAGE
jgi:LPS sulfotransferase NodH